MRSLKECRLRPRLQRSLAKKSSRISEIMQAAAQPLSQLLGPLELDAITVADDAGFLPAIQQQKNLPDFIKTGLPQCILVWPILESILVVAADVRRTQTPIRSSKSVCAESSHKSGIGTAALHDAVAQFEHASPSARLWSAAALCRFGVGPLAGGIARNCSNLTGTPPRYLGGYDFESITDS